jgi:hypothetical protein
MKKLFLVMIALSLFANEIGTLTYKKGIVKVKHIHSIVKKSLNIGDKIKAGDKVYTYNSLATIKLIDNSIIKMDKYSTIKFDKKITQESGRIYYQISKQKHKILEVATTFTTIGVKGTTFIVDNNKTKSVALKKGLISLTAPKGEYEIHIKKPISEFEAYKNSINSEFNEYKKQLYKEFIEYKKSFNLKENHSVFFDGNKAYPLNAVDDKEFEYFEFEFENPRTQFLNNLEEKEKILENKGCHPPLRDKVIDKELDKAIKEEFGE